jgi:hypothetical protein
MRQLFLIFLLTVCFIAKSQERDTIFLKRVLEDTPYHFYNAIYIDTTIKVGNRKTITDFGFSKYDSTTYFEQLKALKPLKKITGLPKGFPRKWILLYRYKDEYYTYVPSEAGENFQFEITDSTTIDYSMEGPQPSKVNNIKVLTARKTLILRNNYWKGKTVYINIIDKDKGIAIFTFSPTKYNKSGYKTLMVSVDKIHNFKTIINYCITDKVGEFEFDKIDFEALEK